MPRKLTAKEYSNCRSLILASADMGSTSSPPVQRWPLTTTRCGPWLTPFSRATRKAAPIGARRSQSSRRNSRARTQPTCATAGRVPAPLWGRHQASRMPRDGRIRLICTGRSDCSKRRSVRKKSCLEALAPPHVRSIRPLRQRRYQAATGLTLDGVSWGQTPDSHRVAQDRAIYLFDCALRINYWRNGRVELRPPSGRAHFCVTDDPRCQHPGCAERPAGRPHASSTDSNVLSRFANILNLTAADYQTKLNLLAKTNPPGRPAAAEPSQGFMGLYKRHPS